MNPEFGNMKRDLVSVCLLLFVSYFLLPTSAFSQQPQAPSGTPLYAANAKYVNGVAPGYWPTAGSGLTLNVSAGTAYCGNPPALVNYAGGTLTMTAGTTNYVYLDPANNCAPSVSTSAFATDQIPIAKVVAGSSSITSITDARTWFSPQPCSIDGSGGVDCSATGTNQDIALTPSGTGATVATNLEDKGGQVFNVKAYGAKGNGSIDDQPAFMAAWNAAVAAGGGIIYFPQTSSCYLMNETWNLTGGTSGDSYPILIEGANSGYGSHPQICMNTGSSPFIDLTAMGGITFWNISASAIVPGLSNPSEIGVISGRTTSGVSGQMDKFIDCTFQLPTHTSGSTVSYGIYYYGVELSYNERDLITADYPLTVSRSNIYGLNSSLDGWTSGIQSETQDSFRDMELDTAGMGPAVTLDGTSNMILTGHSFNFSQSSSYSSSLAQYALVFKNTNRSDVIHWRQEGFPGFLTTQLSLMNSTVSGTDAPGPSPELHGVEFTDGSSQIVNDTFRITDEYSSPTSNFYYDSSGGILTLDHVDFACGGEKNCINIPIGTYLPSGQTAYESNVTYSSEAGNPTPTVNIGGANYVHTVANAGAITMPTAAVAAGGCDSGTSVTNPNVSAKSTILLSNQNWFGLMAEANAGNGSVTVYLCNWTSNSITPGAGTEYYRVMK